jgi:DNA-binding GntR family transcriptional regulator
MSASEDAVHRVLSDALLSARIAPGAPLREVALAEVFGVSRERVRKVLQRLGAERLLELVPNRGAFAAAPSLDQAREVYEARRILEGGIVGHLAQSLDAAAAKALQAHVQQEEAAAAAGDRARSIRLSGEFHLLLGRATGNPLVVRELQHLVSRTSMLVALFEPARSMRCACEEHADILAPLCAGDGSGAMKAMQRHLALIETRLRPAPAVPAGDAVSVISEDWAAWLAAQRKARRAPARGTASGRAATRPSTRRTRRTRRTRAGRTR